MKFFERSPFRRNLGCNVVGCELCKNNPNRRCQTHFREKYVDNANRVLLARCTAPIMVRVVDTVTGEEFIDESLDKPHRLEGAQLQVLHYCKDAPSTHLWQDVRHTSCFCCKPVKYSSSVSSNAMN